MCLTLVKTVNAALVLPAGRAWLTVGAVVEEKVFMAWLGAALGMRLVARACSLLNAPVDTVRLRWALRLLWARWFLVHVVDRRLDIMVWLVLVVCTRLGNWLGLGRVPATGYVNFVWDVAVSAWWRSKGMIWGLFESGCVWCSG